MRSAAAVVIASLLFVPAASIAQEKIPAAVEAPQPSVDGAAPRRCEGVDANICVAAISGATVAAIIAANAITGGALAPILLAGNGGVTAASIIAGLFMAHLGLEIAMIGTGSAAAVFTGVADPVVAAVSDAYAAAKSYTVAAANNVSTTVDNWLNGR
jgi:hypothetical protein